MIQIRIFFVCIVLLLLSTCHASVGDRLSQFRECVERCITDTKCPNLPMHLRLLWWDCSQECDYRCQKIITAARLQDGMSIVQFHGKWPFDRMYGIQEPASVLFSLLNFVPHLKGLRYLLRHRNHGKNVQMRKFYIGFAVIGMNAWLWSSVFHTRDFLVTERLDYYSAGLTILYGLYTAAIRIFRLDMPEKTATRCVFTLLCVALYMCHVGYLQLIEFSYSYNMGISVVVGIIQNVLWIYYSIDSFIRLPEKYRTLTSWTLWPCYIVMSITAGMCFELFDFPPIAFIFDAHSLWHAATIAPTYFWYMWMKRDLDYLTSTKD